MSANSKSASTGGLARGENPTNGNILREKIFTVDPNTSIYLPDAEVIVLSLDDPPKFVSVLSGDEPTAPDVQHLQ